MAASSAGPQTPIPHGMDELVNIESQLAKMESDLLANRDYAGALKLRGGKTGYQPDRYVGDATYDGSYDPDMIYTRSTNSHDHSVTVHIHIPRSVQAAINGLVSMRIWPEYRTAHDFIRNAIIHQLHRDVAKAGNLDSIQPTLDLERVLAWVEEKEQRLSRYDAVCDQVQGMMERAKKVGAWEAVVDGCEMGEALAATLPEPWQGRMRGIVGRWRNEAGAAMQGE